MGFLNLFKRKNSLSDGVLQGATDSHSHVLFGVDDGIKTLEDSLAVLSFLETLGIQHLWCTPHIMEECANDTELLKARFEQLKVAYKGSVRLHLAAEYMLDTVFEQRFRDRELLTHEIGRAHV